MKVQLIGLGAQDNETCFFSNKKATGYVDIGDGDMTPAHVKDLGSGNIGNLVDVPSSWEDVLSNKRKEIDEHGEFLASWARTDH